MSDERKLSVKQFIKSKKGISIIIVILSVYLSFAMYFNTHFYFGTKVNGYSIAGKTVEEANKLLEAKTKSYVLNIIGREKDKDLIKGEEIELTYNCSAQIEEIKNNQGSFGWIIGILKNKDYKIKNLDSYNKEKLATKIDSLIFFSEDVIVEPVNANFEYKNGSYTIIPEINGKVVLKEKLLDSIENKIIKGETELNLDKENCYKQPKLKLDSNEAKSIQSTLNKYISTNITYNVLGEKYIIDGEKINKWLSVNENNEVILNEESVQECLNVISSKYSRVGMERDFKTSLGTVVTVSGGDYGIPIDTSIEKEYLINAIKSGKVEKKEPEFAKAALATGNGIGTTYVEVNLSTQQIWFYKDGNLIVNGDIVTGNADGRHNTPAGVYKLKYTQKDAVLRGPGYAAPVAFWMPFNGDIGMHDATWRGGFGGNIYTYDGSHGCVNLPYNVAKSIYENISAGTPIVCYF